MMKNLFLGIFISLLFALPVKAEFKSMEEAEKKLATYTVTDIDGDSKRLKEGKGLKIDEMFNDLEEAAKLADKNLISEALAFEMCRVTVITFINDRSTFAVELILPAYRKNIRTFEKAAQRLHPYDRDLFLEVTKSKNKAAVEGQD